MATDLPNFQDHPHQIGPLKTSKEFGNLFAALMNAQAEFPIIKKDQQATIKSDRANYKYLYADLADIQNIINPILKKNQLVLITPVVGDTLVTCLMLPISSEWMIAEWPLKLSGNPQQWGSEVTYVRRYSIVAMLNLIVSEDDDDGASASQLQPRQQQQRSQQPSERQQQQPAQSITDQQFWDDWCANCGIQGMHTSEAKKLLTQLLAAVGKKGIRELGDKQKASLLTHCINDACESLLASLKNKQGNSKQTSATGQALAEADARRQHRAAG